MNFDNAAFIELLNNFVLRCGQIRHYHDPEMSEALEPLCRFLRIGRVSVAVFTDSCEPEQAQRDAYVYYDCGRSDDSRCYMSEETAPSKAKARYYFTQISGEPDWSAEELTQVKHLQKQLYINNERLYSMQLVEQMPLHDTEMGAYSLPFFLATAKSLISQGRITEFGAVYFNLKRFSVINKNLGRERADLAMTSFIHGLSEKLTFEECVCRIGGDNFVMLFRKSNLDQIKPYLSGTPVSYGSGDETINITTCAGYYLISDGSDSATDIMDKVSTSYQLAKNVYKRPYIFYDDKIMLHQAHVKEIESMFPSAISGEEFKVFYQPKTQLRNYQMAGAEALCRWFRDGRIIPPGDFIPVLESSRAICTLDFYMLDHVCRDIRRWLDEKREVVKVSVNLSRLHLGDEDLLETILSIIDKYNVPHKYIEIELTETTTDVDFTELKKIVNGLREENISTSVDDFGMGYSSLNLIRELPWNVLKIDKSFLPTQAEDQDISKFKMLRHIITMSQDLGLECIVEGVETAEQVKLLKDCKCFLAQGFYFDKPLPVKEFEQRLDDISAG